MARPVRCRQVSAIPGALYFKPRGIPMTELEEVQLQLDEFEAVRLTDGEGLYQEDAALRMRISRQTYANILNRARRKIADCLIHGRALRVEGGQVQTTASARKQLQKKGLT